MSGTGSDNGWLEAAVAWEVCASLHRQYCKGKDALFTTRQSDFVKHAENARGRASHGQAPATQPVAREPLARQQLREAFYSETACTLGGDVDFAEKVCRVVEKAHGIKGGQHDR